MLGYGAGTGATTGAFGLSNATRSGLAAWTVTGDVVGVARSSYNVVNAQESLADFAGFAPTVGWGTGAMRGARSLNQMAGSDFLENTGRLGGELYDTDTLRQLDKYLARRGVTLKVGDQFVPAGRAGAFSRDGSTLVLLSNPTKI